MTQPQAPLSPVQAAPPQAPGPRVKYKRSFRNYLIDSRFQLKYTSFILIAAVTISTVLGVFLWRTSGEVVAESQKVVEQSKKVSDVVKMSIKDDPVYGSNPLTRALTRDWRGSVEYQVQTGFPLTISVFGDTANAGTVVGENPIRANSTGQKIFGPGTRNSSTWFNPGAFAAPPAYTYGNVGRNSVYGPGLQTMDLGIVREFSVAEKARFEARAEFFNALNHTNLGTPNRFVNTSSFGSITEVATPGREIQVSARLSF